jgi:hypothetical protein
MSQSVKEYVQTCHTCQTVKYSTQKAHGLLMPIPPPERRWFTVTCDFITGLPMSKKGHDAILVFTDKLSKMAHYAPTTSSATAQDWANLYQHWIVRLHGMPKHLITDRGTQFTSTFITSLTHLCGTKQGMSTAYHPQTDGQTERLNSMLEDYLRSYTGDTQEEWDEHLWCAEFAYNNSFHSTIGTTPFFMNYGFDPRSPQDALMDPLPPRKHFKVASTAQVFADKMDDLVRHAHTLAKQAMERMVASCDKRRQDLRFKVGDQVLLATKHLRIPGEGLGRSTRRKLLPRFIGPFPILKEISRVTYKLHLPANMKCFHTFHVCVLRPYHYREGMAQPPPPTIFAGFPEWEVDAVMEAKEVDVKSGKSGRTRKETWYRVRWTGYGPSFDTWEPKSHMKNAKKAIADFEARVAKEGAAAANAPAQDTPAVLEARDMAS